MPTERWVSEMRTRLSLFACLLFAIGWSSASAAESFPFWPGKGAEAAPGFQRMSEHPCGEVAYAEVSKLPTTDNGPLLSEVVVELGRRGKVVRRWPTPVDSVPHSVSGAELLFMLGERGFWVRSDGSFRRAATPATGDGSALLNCDLTSVFGKSGYAQCSIFVDLVSRKKRTLGYQGVCS